MPGPAANRPISVMVGDGEMVTVDEIRQWPLHSTTDHAAHVNVSHTNALSGYHGHHPQRDQRVLG